MSKTDNPHTTARVLEEAGVPRAQMPLKIGVMGGAGHDTPAEHLDKADQLGEAIATSDCIVITGACPGLPLAAL